jgi:hypothetical protein
MPHDMGIAGHHQAKGRAAAGTVVTVSMDHGRISPKFASTDVRRMIGSLGKRLPPATCVGKNQTSP